MFDVIISARFHITVFNVAGNIVPEFLQLLKSNHRVVMDDGGEVHPIVELPRVDVRHGKADGKFKQSFLIHKIVSSYLLCGVMTGAGERWNALRSRNDGTSLYGAQSGVAA